MVKVRDDLPQTNQGTIDLAAWTSRICYERPDLNQDKLVKAAEFALDKGATIMTPYDDSCFRYGLAIAEVLKSLEPDLPTFISAILYHSLYYEACTIEEIEKHFGLEVVKLLKGLMHVDSTHQKQSENQQRRNYPLTASSPDNLRRMLLAVVEDIRVVLIKLAERVAALRACSHLEGSVKSSIAKEAHEVFAPLANRLGIGQIKWEIEDLSFRYLEPTSYKQIAKSLAEKRLDREEYIQDVITLISDNLKEEGIEAQVYGRVKHIYSIWRKMKRKNLDFSEIYDVRAIRVIVNQLRDCYAALGVVHSLWQHIPQEFDDYIATPKENGYRSLHTAVIGPQGKTVEIQIRTLDMHQEAELGVAAHWMYKEGSAQDASYQAKLNAIRNLLHESETLDSDKESEEYLQTELGDDRVYVFSPHGDVMDLPTGSTPLDFAFQIHTELGYRCRGAKINGSIVPLTYQLKSGDQVEVLTIKEGGPSRDWLNPHLGYIKSSKSRQKINVWFKKQERDQNIEQGRDTIEREFKRLHLNNQSISKLAQSLKYKKTDDMYAALGVGDLRLAQVLNKIHEIERPVKEEVPQTKPEIQPIKKNAISIQGIGNLKYSFAKCCKPIPFDPIIGFISVGRGIIIHRSDCIHVMQEFAPERQIQVNWGEQNEDLFPVDIEIYGFDRQGLLRDIMSVLTSEKIRITGTRSSTDTKTNEARIVLNLQVEDLATLGKILNKVLQIPNVIDASRVSEGRKK